METEPLWRKSRRCESGACVEFAAFGGDAAIRDSTDPRGPILRFPRAEWVTFLDRITSDGFRKRS
jgi:Domain of unknown function (DUF397).